jgi:hypothetical protein
MLIFYLQCDYICRNRIVFAVLVIMYRKFTLNAKEILLLEEI